VPATSLTSYEPSCWLMAPNFLPSLDLNQIGVGVQGVTSQVMGRRHRSQRI
jgi:hypothetical protein